MKLAGQKRSAIIWFGSGSVGVAGAHSSAHPLTVRALPGEEQQFSARETFSASSAHTFCTCSKVIASRPLFGNRGRQEMTKWKQRWVDSFNTVWPLDFFWKVGG